MATDRSVPIVSARCTVFCEPGLAIPGAERSLPPTNALGDWYVVRLNIGWHRLLLGISSRGAVPLIIPARGPESIPVKLGSGLERLFARTDSVAARWRNEVAVLARADIRTATDDDLLERGRAIGWQVRDLLRHTDGEVTLDEVAFRVATTGGALERAAELVR